MAETEVLAQVVPVEVGTSIRYYATCSLVKFKLSAASDLWRYSVPWTGKQLQC